MRKTAAYVALVSGLILGVAFPPVEADPFHNPMSGDPIGGSPHGGMAENLFRNMDTNGDGVVSRAEFDAYNAKRFMGMDTNKDGNLTLEEMQGANKQGAEQGSGTKHLDDRFNSADVNHDGFLDRDEAKALPMLDMYFDEVDTNKDGKITRQEYLDAMPKLHRSKQKDAGKQQT